MQTVQSIGLMLANKPERGKGKPRTTLIVVPLALKEQWKSEIEMKTETDALRVWVHHGTGRTTGALGRRNAYDDSDVEVRPCEANALRCELSHEMGGPSHIGYRS